MSRLSSHSDICSNQGPRDSAPWADHPLKSAALENRIVKPPEQQHPVRGALPVQVSRLNPRWSSEFCGCKTKYEKSLWMSASIFLLGNLKPHTQFQPPTSPLISRLARSTLKSQCQLLIYGIHSITVTFAYLVLLSAWWQMPLHTCNSSLYSFIMTPTSGSVRFNCQDPAPTYLNSSPRRAALKPLIHESCILSSSYIYICAYTYIHAYIHIHVCTYIYAYTHTCICVYIIFSKEISRVIPSAGVQDFSRKPIWVTSPNFYSLVSACRNMSMTTFKFSIRDL